MLIAVAAGSVSGAETVPESYEESRSLWIIETEDGSVLKCYEAQGDPGLFFAERTVAHACEAIACGRFHTPEAFEYLAGNCITRYYAAGLPVQEAAMASDRGVLPLLTDYEGGNGCGSHQDDSCEEGHSEHF